MYKNIEQNYYIKLRIVYCDLMIPFQVYIHVPFFQAPENIVF